MAAEMFSLLKCHKRFTVKFINLGMPEIFAVIYLKFKQRGQTYRVLGQYGANGIANSEDSDQTAPLGAVLYGSALFAQTYLSENLGSLRYIKFNDPRHHYITVF